MSILIAFDVDGTLALHNEPVEPSILDQLYDLAAKHTIVFISGKPCAYLSGLTRQLGLKDIYICGENGAEYYYPSQFPPEVYEIAYEKRIGVTETLRAIRADIEKHFGDNVWFQPNIHALSFFPKSNISESLDEIEQFLLDHYSDVIDFNGAGGLTFFKHHDAIEIVPEGISKGNAVRKIAQRSNCNKIIAIGDGQNDISMLEIADHAIGIGIDTNNKKHVTVSNTEEAFSQLGKLLS